MEEQLALRKLRVWQCVKVLLIFLGLFGMQMLSLIICTIVYFMLFFAKLWQHNNLFTVVNELNTNSDFLLTVSAVSAFLAMIWCGILYRRSTWRVEKNDYRAVFSIKNVLGIIAVGVGGCVFLSVLVSIVSNLVPSAFENYSRIMNNLTEGTPALSYVYVLIIGPISEELIFRGAMQDRFRVAFPVWLAIVLQAFLFGVYHMNLIQGAYAFCLGALLGLICYKTGSIFASMLTHCLFNATSFALSAVSSEIAKLMLFVVSIVVFAAGVRYFLRVEKIEKTC